MRLVNLTPHDVVVLDAEGREVERLLPSQNPARCSVRRVQIGSVNGIPLYRSQFGQVENLPEPDQDAMYIVSRVVAEANKSRADLLVPDDVVRDSRGNALGCRGFTQANKLS